MSNKKQARFIGIDPNVAFRLQLDPDIYNSQVGPILGIGNVLLSQNVKVVPVSISTALRSGLCSRIKARCVKGDEVRQVDLICDVDNADTAKIELVDKTIKLGFGANLQTWTIERCL
ncbi:MAG: hypothetical protein IM531_02455 [Pseudanabaena sp. M090S1SP1A06QC]|jgi:hypothetical protein|nr:hypothetical protein [Pseudanabaena sp. M109S1SP1A06QC]MCA6603308.1 hypothetical protein [Pseudanabaena sp. M007S1SP1A06QC]MCA6613560.1 hypothetical protein [Pseudanabaena sp. M090S1SP1A06QC]MCA6624343.1 hypothetical protein [Pseudanabaena sp. M165S2SP1A06QC]